MSNRIKRQANFSFKTFVKALICMLKLIGKVFKARLFFVGVKIKLKVMVAIPTY